jgi:hypothetical protein
MGSFIAEFIQDIPDKTMMAMVVTHSKPILSKLAPLDPTHVRIGHEMTIADYIADDKEKLPGDLEKLITANVAGTRAIAKLVKGKN